MIGMGIPSSQNRHPLPKPISTSLFYFVPLKMHSCPKGSIYGDFPLDLYWFLSSCIGDQAIGERPAKPSVGVVPSRGSDRRRAQSEVNVVCFRASRIARESTGDDIAAACLSTRSWI